jgi:uncharacterized protein (UPF0276 family)
MPVYPTTRMNGSEPRLSGIGLSATLPDAVKLCRWRLENRQVAWSYLGYLQIGLYSHEDVPVELVPLLRETALPSAVHLLEINFMEPLAAQKERLEPLLRRIEHIEPLCVEEDLGLWCWGQTVLEQHMLPPIRDEETAAVIARNVAELQATIGVPFYVENPPIYFDLGTLDLLTFMQRVAERARCNLVLDIGHLVGYCAATGREPQEYLEAWTGLEHVRELHVAGYNLFPDQGTPTWYDNHPEPISEYALELIDLVRRQAGGPLPVTLEQEGASWGRIVEHVKLVAARVAP